ncbi:hypothetical protein [Hoylesella loescheii]|uniref:hypothetical protein n=1 Tax=Hoylesella loescheii TaxID=840 RepID=UPI00248DB712|nr:hypothetical protein [Hoylesella loescheii]
MEIILNCGDKINIPDGCKAEIKDGVITIEKEGEKFKNGDILAYVGCTDNTSTFIYKGEDENGSHKYYAGITIYNKLSISDDRVDRWGRKEVRLATEEEKQYLFDKMAEQGLRWNAEEKRVEKIRWRAKKSQSYFFIDKDINSMEEEESGDVIDDILWRKFNYFRTEEDARKAAELVKATLRKFHEDNESNK